MPATVGTIIFLIITLALGFNNGSFVGDPIPIIFFTIAFILFLFAFLKPDLFDQKHDTTAIPFLALTCALLFPFFIPGWWASDKNLMILIRLISTCCALGIIVLSFSKNLSMKLLWSVYAILIGTAVLLRLLTLHASPFPPIDVFIILKEAPLKLLSGINPYNTLYTAVFPKIVPDYFAYWPAAFLLQIPFVLVFNDPRVLLILADIFASLLLLTIGRGTKLARLLSLIYLYRPLSLFIIEASWLTPLNFSLIALCVFLLLGKRKLAAGMILGIGIGVQFFLAALLIPFIRYVNHYKAFFIAAFGVAALLTSSFILLSPDRFFLQTISVYFQNPPHPSILPHTSLSLNTLFFTLTGKDFPAIFMPIIVLATLVLLFTKQAKTLSGKVAWVALVNFAVYLFGKQAFVNYYYFIASLLLLSFTLRIGETGQEENK